MSLLLLVFMNVQAQEFFQQSFESETGWTLSHTFNDGADSYSEREVVSALQFLGYTLSGQEGSYVIAVENTDGVDGQSPSDGVITLELDPVDISGKTDLEVLVKLSCNADEEPYDDRSLPGGDYLDLEVNIDGAGWNTIAQFNSKAGDTSISTLYHDVDMDGDGGELGELPVGNAMTDFILPVTGTGSSLQMRAVMKMDGNAEVLVLDDVRLKESTGDVTPPSVYSAGILDQNSLEVVFQEAMSSSSAEQTFHYTGVPGLSTATLQADQQTVVLDFSSDFELGEPYQLIVFGVMDVAGNSMIGAFNFPFYYNPSTPDLVITEIMYNDPSEEDSLEFIEIYNHGSTDAVVGGFRLEDAVSHTLASVTIAPGGFYLAARNAEAASGFYTQTFEDYGGQLSDNSENIVLVNADGVGLDAVEYNDNVPWPSAADGTGPSMELISPELDNQVGSNWVASTNGIGVVNGMPLSASPGSLSGGVLPIIQFDNNDMAVNEVDGVIQIEIYIAASDPDPSSIHIEMVAGTATSPEDHGANSIMDLTLPGNSSGIELVAIPLVNDNILEGVEYFTLQMTAVSNCTIGLNDELTVVIADDEYVAPQLYLNELQSSNSATIPDNAGDYDDWFEIFNPTAEPVDLAGFYVSDDPSDPLKDRIGVGETSTIIPPMGFILFWADEEGEQGPLHTNFKLSSGGESLLLTGPDGTALLDEVLFGAIATDLSYGRQCDGEDNWMVFTTPTPGESNCIVGLQDPEGLFNGLYPNPANEAIHLPRVMEFSLWDASGRQLMRGNDKVIRIDGLNPGIYLLRSGSSSARIVIN